MVLCIPLRFGPSCLPSLVTPGFQNTLCSFSASDFGEAGSSWVFLYLSSDWWISCSPFHILSSVHYSNRGLSSRGFPQLCSFSTLLVTLDTCLASCCDVCAVLSQQPQNTSVSLPLRHPQPSHTVVLFGDISFLPGFFFPSRVAFCTHKQANRNDICIPTEAYCDYCSASSFFPLNILGDGQC